jgi:hypothetical protein
MQVILSSSRLESLKVLAISTRSRPEKNFLADEGAGIAINEFLANEKGLCEAIGRGLPCVRGDSGERRSGGASKGGGREIEPKLTEREDPWSERSDTGDDTGQAEEKS